MTTGTTAVALAVRAHPRGGAPSGDEATVRALRDAAASLGRRNADMLTGPSSVSPEGTLTLALSSPGEIVEAMLSLADDLRPLGTTFCAAVSAAGGTREAASPDRLESTLLAAEAAASLAVHGVGETDLRERRVSIMAPEYDSLASSLADMLLASYDAMTLRQRQIIALIKESETQQQVATHLAVSRQAVNQSLAAAGWPHVKRAEGAIREHLSARARSGAGESGERAR